MNDTPTTDTSLTEKLEARLAQISSKLDGFEAASRKRDETDRDRQFAEAESKITAALSKVDGEVDTAEKALAAALDEGDAATIARRHRELSDASSRRVRMQGEADVVRSNLKRARDEKPQAPSERDQKTVDSEQVSTENRDAWLQRNSWFGSDPEMTAAAQEINQAVRAANLVEPGSKAYFDDIDRKMKQRFPDRFSGSPGGFSGKGSGMSDNPGDVRIDASIAEGWRRMGFDTKDPKVIERLMGARKIAVDKGILPEKPVLGRVYTA